TGSRSNSAALRKEACPRRARATWRNRIGRPVILERRSRNRCSVERAHRRSWSYRLSWKACPDESCLGTTAITTAPAARGPLARAFCRVRRGGLASGREQGLHLLQRIGLDLADALGGDAVLVGQLLQRHLVVGVEPAALDDVARTRVQAGQPLAQQFEAVVGAVHALVGLGRILLVRDQVRGGRRRRAVVILVGRGVAREVAAGQARVHPTNLAPRAGAVPGA